MNKIHTFLVEYYKVFLAVVVVWICFIGSLFLAKYFGYSIDRLGVFGDSFNVITSLFTGLAFSGVIVSIILQTTELGDTREQLRLQKEELAKQNKEMRKQSFDNKFFQMLHLFNDVIDNLLISEYAVQVVSGNISNQKNEYIGKEALHYLQHKFKENIEEMKDKKFQDIFDEFNSKYNTSFKYYFINLYQILKFINDDIPNEVDVKKYTNILRAQLSKNELVLLSFNAIGMMFYSENYKRLIEKYQFLEHLQFDDFEQTDDVNIPMYILKQYDVRAFGDNKNMISLISNSYNVNGLANEHTS